MIHIDAKAVNVVLDIGSFHTFAGEAGLENPRFASHSYVVENTSFKKGQFQAGKQALNSQNVNKQIHSIFEEIGTNGKVDKFHFNIDKFDKFVETILMDNLQLDNYSISLLIAQDMSVQLQQSEVLKQRQKILDYLLQGMELSNIAFVKKPILSTFAVGRTSSVVLDSGHSFSHCSIVQDGYCVYNKTVRFGGSTIHDMIQEQILKKSGQKQFKISRQNVSQPFKPSDVRFHKIKEIQDIINKFLYVLPKSTMPPQDNQISYTLPDGHQIKIKRSQIVDPFVNYDKFWTKYLKQQSQELPHYAMNLFLKGNNGYRGLQQLIYSTVDQYAVCLDHKNKTVASHSLSSSSPSKRNQLGNEQLLNNVILTGGNLHFNDMAYKISQGVHKKGGSIVDIGFPLLANSNANSGSANNVNGQKNKNSSKQDSAVNSNNGNGNSSNSLSWIGGSIICGLDVFNHFWIKQSQWKQFGTNILATSKNIGELVKNPQIVQMQEMSRKSKKIQLISKKCT